MPARRETLSTGINGMTVEVPVDNDPQRLLAALRPALEKLSAAGVARISVFDMQRGSFQHWVAISSCDQSRDIVDTADDTAGIPLWSQLDLLSVALLRLADQLTP